MDKTNFYTIFYLIQYNQNIMKLFLYFCFVFVFAGASHVLGKCSPTNPAVMAEDRRALSIASGGVLAALCF
jgi:hypothetical protein